MQIAICQNVLIIIVVNFFKNLFNTFKIQGKKNHYFYLVLFSFSKYSITNYCM